MPSASDIWTLKRMIDALEEKHSSRMAALEYELSKLKNPAKVGAKAKKETKEADGTQRPAALSDL